jgi:uncharacterized 2Fe-2S/4Fe-4S cluster protein (DUF4445 family)
LTKLCKLNMLPGSKTAEFANGTILIDALEDMGVMLPSPCGGRGICAKCLVQASGELSIPSEAEKRIIKGHKGCRLACQAVIEGDVHVSCEQKQQKDDRRFQPIDKIDKAGLAVDIGTTSVQVSLAISKGESILLGDFINPQRRYGNDVISRIAAARNKKAADDMTRRIRNAIKTVTLRSLEAMGLRADSINRIVISGNTTMLYFFFGLDVSPLGMHPYRAEVIDLSGFRPADVGMEDFACAEIESMPILSAFVGGDAVSGFSLYYSDGPKKNTFYIDLGTNGEIVVVNSRAEISAASCAMGPALEGMNISCGMSADDGAITHARLEGGAMAYDMIGRGDPVGLSGTALIDIAALLLESGGMKCRGTIAAPGYVLPAPAEIVIGGEGKSVHLWKRLSLTQGDLRNLQLAKGASFAASQLLLEASGCGAEKIERVIIAGALGCNLEMDNFRRLGFIPEFPNAEYIITGNASLEAAALACKEDGFLKRAREIRNRMTEVPLAGSDKFRRCFIDALDFPSGP